MPRPWRLTYAGAQYHITARGNARQKIFYDDSDYERFLEQLAHALEKDSVTLYEYCLMPNHYHLHIKTPLGNVKRFMQRLNTAYSMYFRYKHRKPGHCFQGRYGAKVVSGDDYIIRLSRYIHLNPVKVGRIKLTPDEKMKYLKSYRWSSLSGYLDKALAEDIVDYSWLALMGRKTLQGNRNGYRKFIADAVEREDKDFIKALGISRYAIGDDKFVEESENDLRDQLLDKQVYGDVAAPGTLKSVDVDVIKSIVLREYTLKESDLYSRSREVREAKLLFIELCCRYSEMTQRDVALLLGYKSESSVVMQRKSLRLMITNDDRVKKRLSALEVSVKKTRG